MKERTLDVAEIFELTTAHIGHCNNIEQLEYIVMYTKARIKALKARETKKKPQKAR